MSPSTMPQLIAWLEVAGLGWEAFPEMPDARKRQVLGRSAELAGVANGLLHTKSPKRPKLHRNLIGQFLGHKANF
jgi:hypothetical protein